MTVQEILKETLELERERRHRRHDVEIFDRLLATLDEVPPSLWHAYAAARERDTNAGISGGGTFVESDYSLDRLSREARKRGSVYSRLHSSSRL